MFTNYSAPVCLFVYKRIDTLKATVASLAQNRLAAVTDLHIFSDGPANESDRNAVMQVRAFIQQIRGFKSVSVTLSETNKGLASSVIDGVTHVINQEGRTIVLEDDLVVSPNFLDFMNAALNAYADIPSVFSVSGYSAPVRSVGGTDVYFTLRASSWGWATWKDRWEKIDWEVKDYKSFIQDRQRQKQFNRMGSDLCSMLKKCMEGRINSWAIRWTYHQFRYGLFTVFPVISKVVNEGFSSESTHTFKAQRSRFATRMDASYKNKFYFPPIPYLNPEIIKQFIAPFSIRKRVFYKIKSLLT